MIQLEFKGLSQARSYLLKAAEIFSDFFGTTLLFSNTESVEASSTLFLFPHQIIEIDFQEQDPWSRLKKEMGNFKTSSPYPMWSGYLSYEMGAYTDPKQILPFSPSQYPLAYFQKSSIQLIQKGGSVTLLIHEEYQNKLLRQAKPCNPYFKESYWKTFFSKDPSITSKEGTVFEIEESDTLSSYCNKIEQAKEFIKAGDIYQVNLSRSVHFKTDLPSFEIFHRLIQINPTPYSAFVNCGDFQILSISPEKLLTHTSGLLETRPIKGTIGRGKTALEDEKRQKQLLNDSKEDAELMMICDLMRNDLGRISKVGSIKCKHLKKLLTLSNLYHLESVIQGEGLEMHPLDYLKHCFPAGSITGCPKIRSMQIIQLLEKRARHIYCGSIGYFKENGDFDFSVSIRTAVKQKNDLELQIGGAITYDSNPEKEYDETQVKAASFNKILLKTDYSSIP